MKSSLHSKVLAGVFSLFALPLAFAGDASQKFAKMDTNGDGQISRSEFLAGANQKFATMDANRDGVITAAELETKKSSTHGDKHRDDMSASSQLKLMDQNADGQVTTAEHNAHVEAVFAKMDTNQDGSLSKDELESGHEMKKKH
ncbi:EF-hand domain-containing protein [Opitutus terrae]|uniref:Calcium-binding EF-hand-containing protein n=1 Tax=Opitutus terrae (strain DSM 11246 / JCM 15787 / PB90-1) TaxID=452637 RepID=B1ZNR1_OPITP|nr:EF-hand domain-containing protein [Opitutus terrae]ACB75431.1 Calcium-binding EF-hand-containing protein [Opitutus terrae PB90-1]